MILGIETEETNPLMYIGFAIPAVVLGLMVRATLRRWRLAVPAVLDGTFDVLVDPRDPRRLDVSW